MEDAQEGFSEEMFVALICITKKSYYPVTAISRPPPQALFSPLRASQIWASPHSSGEGQIPLPMMCVKWKGKISDFSFPLHTHHGQRDLSIHLTLKMNTGMSDACEKSK